MCYCVDTLFWQCLSQDFRTLLLLVGCYSTPHVANKSFESTTKNPGTVSSFARRRPLSVQNVNCFLANEFARLSVADFIRRISKESSPLLLLLLLLATSTRLRLVTIIRLLCTAKHCTRMCKFIITVLCVCARRQSVHTYMSWPSSSSSSWCM